MTEAPRSADSLDPELRPGLPVPFAMKGRRFEHPANVADPGHCQVNESGTYEGGRIRDQAAGTAVHTVNARARNIRC